MKKSKRILAILLSGIVLTITVIPARAADISSEKEEVVYVNLDTEGQVKDIYVVNIFGKGDVTDYGDYSTVKMLNTTDAIHTADDRITFSSTADRVYYEGKMKQTVIPWNISLKYFMDGKEYRAEEIAGKSGKLEIHMSVKENKACKGDYFDDYALQVTFTLDTEKAANIIAEDAAVANVGSDKQLVFTILPGKEKDITVTADVTDFEMAAVSINGIRLNLNAEVDEDELLDQIRELQDAIKELDDGSLELQDGVKELKDSVEDELQSGVDELTDGSIEMRDGARELKDGGTDLNSGALDMKTGTEELYSGAVSLDNGISEIESGLKTLDQNSETLTQGSARIKAALLEIQQKLAEGTISSDDIQTLVSTSAGIKAGIDEAYQGVKDIRAMTNVTAYEQIMTQNLVAAGALPEGASFSLSGLKDQNSAAIEGLGNLVSSMESAGEGEEESGGGTANEAVIAQLGSVIGLLQLNNANIDGICSYLAGIDAALAQLEAGEDGTGGLAALSAGYAAFDAKIQELAVSLNDMSASMAELKAGIDTLVSEYGKLDKGISEYTAGVSGARKGSSELKSGSTALVEGAGSLKSGSGSLYEGTRELLDGIVEFYDATGTLTNGTGDLDEGVQELLSGIISLYDGAGEMKDGTGKLREETDGMDQEIRDKIDELLDTISGGDGECVSFVSEKNTNVDNLQFVIQTQAIEIPEPEEEETVVEEKLNIWQKTLRLFGLY